MIKNRFSSEPFDFNETYHKLLEEIPILKTLQQPAQLGFHRYPNPYSELVDKRRIPEGFYERFCYPSQNRNFALGLDVGYGLDILYIPHLTKTIIFGFEQKHGDGTLLLDIPDSTFCFTYASHILEDLDKPETAVANWIRVTKPLGHVIISIPHKLYYEKKELPPSLFNPNHAKFYLPFNSDNSLTLSLYDTLKNAISLSKRKAQIVSINEQLRDNNNWMIPNQHPKGEFSIEAAIQILN